MTKRASASDPISRYLHEIQRNLSSGIAREQTYRRALEDLLESLDPTIEAFNDPKHIEVGAPDFTIRRKGKATDFPVGHVETKDIDDDLDKTEKSEQLKRYLGLPSLLLTDYLEFRWYADGKLRLPARLASVGPRRKLHVEPDGPARVRELLEEFLRHSMAEIVTPHDLAVRMAGIAHLIREIMLASFGREAEAGRLHKQLEAFRETLIPDLKPDQFADMYAQTIAYGLFAARCQPRASAKNFSLAEAANLIPKTNPFLRKLFQEIAFEMEGAILETVQDLVRLLSFAEIGMIMADFGRRTAKEDPVVHFYEDFLKEYDPKVREMRGVYYTPEPVVSYIVRSVDHLLKTEFNKPMGLADKDVLILDPACGTGTFLYAAINHIHDALVKAGQKGQWSRYVSENLLKRIFGFELLMAPYAVAHLKLGLLLQELGYSFESNERLGVYLTNTLEEAIRKSQQVFAFADAITEEGKAAQRVKHDEKIMVVLGNPPYSGHSANRSWEMRIDPKTTRQKKFLTFIGKLMQDYYFVDGKPLGEKNPKWLQDDYVKFIRFGQWRIQRTGYGILAFITNHGYLDNPTFRGMRQQLMDAFSEISLLDLHGNAKKKETALDGSKDENVFDIQQGVAVGIFQKGIKNTGGKRVRQSDLFGPREQKYKFLNEADVSTTPWATLTTSTPKYLYVPQSDKLRAEYEKGWKITDILPTNSAGIVTARDHLAVQFTETEMFETAQGFASLGEEEAREIYALGKDARDWRVAWAQADVNESGPSKNRVRQILYRPFDFRFTYYTGHSRGFICMPRADVMSPMLDGNNIGLAWTRPMSPNFEFSVLVSKLPIDQCAIGNKSAGAGISYLGVLYSDPSAPTLLDPEPTRGSCIAPQFIEYLGKALSLQFTIQPRGDLKKSFGSEDILHYIYAVLSAPTYRKRYEEFLKSDIPFVPLTTEKTLFASLARLGSELVATHLLESQKIAAPITRYEQPGEDAVEKVLYAEPNPKVGTPTGRVFINSKQFFDGVPAELWQFHIGGYHVCEKWLKDRKGRRLSSDEIDHYQKVIVALAETIRIMREIDDLIPDWPLK
jgi:predicted helicase